MPLARKVLTALALAALGVWAGGMIALGAIAAPVVFGVVPAPTSAEAMTIVFRRFDKLAVACVMLVLLVEAGLAALKDRKPGRIDLARGVLALGASACAMYGAAFVSPRIAALHEGGAIRGLGPLGTELDAIHRVAERLGKIELTLALVLMVLHVFNVSRTDTRSSHSAQNPH